MIEIKWIEEAIETFAETGIMEDGTYWRATYTKEDNEGVALLQKWMKEKGMNTYFDEVGNLYGRIEGESKKVVLTGSHRDTVKDGGKLDGALGIIAGIEAIASLLVENGKPKKTVEVVAICEEESSRFLSSYIGSRAIVGSLKEEHLKELDSDGISVEKAMRECGYYKGDLPEGRKDLEAFVELHIEQGGILEKMGKGVGVVTSIVGLYSGIVSFRGEQNHAGTTSMSLRKDPMNKVAEFITHMNLWACSKEDKLVFTIGDVEVFPGKSNVIPNEIILTFDLRSGDEALIKEAIEKMEEFVAEKKEQFEIAIKFASEDSPMKMDGEGIKKMEELAKLQGINYMKIASGAGHDSQIIGEKVKTNMIFVLSEGGISHSPKEHTKIEDINTGYRLLKEFIREIAW